MNKTGVDLALALDRDGPSRFADELVQNQFVGCSRDVDPTWDAVRFHSGSSVDGVSPYVVLELVGPDDATYNGPRADANTEIDMLPRTRTYRREL